MLSGDEQQQDTTHVVPPLHIICTVMGTSIQTTSHDVHVH